MDAMRDAYEEFAATPTSPASSTSTRDRTTRTRTEATPASSQHQGQDPGREGRGRLPRQRGFGCPTPGLHVLFSQTTGSWTILLDNGHLTDVRTAAAACLCISKFAPAKAASLSILGTGVVAKLVAEYAVDLGFGGIIVSSRTSESAEAFAAFAKSKGWAKVSIESYAAATARADVVVCCTPSTEPLVPSVKPGALVVALGADGPGKRELGQRAQRRREASMTVASSARPSARPFIDRRPREWRARGAAAGGGADGCDGGHGHRCDLSGIATRDAAALVLFATLSPLRTTGRAGHTG